MKSKITTIIIALLLVVTTISKAQSASGWIDTGAIWHHGFWEFNFGNPTGFYINKYEGDTTINNRLFQKVSAKKQTKTIYPNDSVVYTDTLIVGTYYFHTSNDTVYKLQNNTLQFLWCNNPTVGDIWDYGLQLNFITNTSKHVYAKIDSIIARNINGIQTKDIYARACSDTFGTPVSHDLQDSSLFINFLSYPINSKLGPTAGYNDVFFFPFWPSNIPDVYVTDKLLCFESFNFPFYQVTGADCNNNIFTSSRRISETNDNIKIYPNPTSDILNINYNLTNNTITTIQIINSHGEIINEFKKLQKVGCHTMTIDTKQFTKGIYYLKSTSNKNNFLHKFIIN